jgi:hypothetical protein
MYTQLLNKLLKQRFYCGDLLAKLTEVKVVQLLSLNLSDCINVHLHDLVANSRNSPILLKKLGNFSSFKPLICSSFFFDCRYSIILPIVDRFS